VSRGRGLFVLYVLLFRRFREGHSMFVVTSNKYKYFQIVDIPRIMNVPGHHFLGIEQAVHQ